MEKAFVTALGSDKTGIVYEVSKILYNNNVNIIDISQKVFTDNLFSMIMLVELPKDLSIEALRLKFDGINNDELKIYVQGTKLFNSMYKL